MINIVHAADFHLDAPFRALPPEKAGQLRQEQRALLGRLSELCNMRKADLLLLSGDLFDSAGVYQDTLHALHRAFSECRAQVFIAPGNHDYAAPGSPWFTEQWPDNVHIFRQGAIQSVVLEALGCQVYGAAFTAPECHGLLRGFRAEDPALVNLMVLHGDAEQPDSPYNGISRSEIAESGLDYLALGHIHKCSSLRTAGTTRYAWPGCPMGRGFDELGARGVLFLSIDKNTCDMEFVPLATRNYEIYEIPAGEDAVASSLAALPEGTNANCCRIVLTGEADTPDTRAVYNALKDRFFSLTVLDRTTPRVKLWAACGEDSLKGLYLQTLQQQRNEAKDAQTRDTVQLAARLGLDLMEGREVVLP
jgi:DNA repair exonuclease SbcCD nuclease subunit